jgi:hypothetical protein
MLERNLISLQSELINSNNRLMGSISLMIFVAVLSFGSIMVATSCQRTPDTVYTGHERAEIPANIAGSY